MVSLNEHTLFVEQLEKLCRDIVAEKRPVYTQGNMEDVHKNFRLGASLTGCSAGTNLMVQAAKQFIAMGQIMTNPNCSDTETRTRFADLRNYIDLAYSLYMAGQQHDRA